MDVKVAVHIVKVAVDQVALDAQVVRIIVQILAEVHVQAHAVQIVQVDVEDALDVDLDADLVVEGHALQDAMAALDADQVHAKADVQMDAVNGVEVHVQQVVLMYVLVV